MKQSPENSPEQEITPHEARIELSGLRELLHNIDTYKSGPVIDLNEQISTRETETPDFIEERKFLFVDALREAVGKVRRHLPSFQTEVEKHEAEGLLMVADLYLAAHDQDAERIQKSLVLARLKKPMTAAEVLEAMKKQGFRPLSLKEAALLYGFSSEEWKKKLSEIGWDFKEDEGGKQD